MALATKAVSDTNLIQEHKAFYEAKIDHGLSLNGSAVRELRQAKGSSWSYSFFVDTLPATIHEQSTFSLSDTQIHAQMYSYALEGTFIKNRYQTAKFSESNGTESIDETYKDKSWNYSGNSGVLDRLNYQLQLQIDVASGKQEMLYLVAHKGKLRRYQFKTTGQQVINTALGEKESFVVEKVRESNNRETTLWFDTSAPYTLLRFIQTETNGDRYEINIKRLELLN